MRGSNGMNSLYTKVYKYRVKTYNHKDYKMAGAEGVGSMVKGTCYSSRGCRFDSWYPHGSLQPSETPPRGV